MRIHRDSTQQNAHFQMANSTELFCGDILACLDETSDNDEATMDALLAAASEQYEHESPPTATSYARAS